MPLNNEWKHRLEAWMNELKNHFYRELGSVEFEGFTTFDHLLPEDARKRAFFPMPPGSSWGAKWEYAWFRGKLRLPEEAEGKRIVFRLNTGGESMIVINGRIAGAKDLEHHEITLCRCGHAGEVYEILAETYAGHGVREENCPPVPPGRVTVPEPPEKQTEVGRSTFGIFEEDAYQLWIDVTSLYLLRCNINNDSLRASKIDKGLMDFTMIADFELPYDQRIKTFKEARKRLAPLLDCVNGSTAPSMYIFGHSHLDLAWKWPFAETERKCARTLSTQLAMMDEYPEYTFLLTQVPVYEVLKKRYPDLYERLREKVRAGRLFPEGGMWLEADTNLSGGECLVRQFVYGKRFFKEDFGIDSTLLWLPDVFGFTAALPQIMKGCGIRYFATQKIFCNYNGGDPFPYNHFVWEGLDGSEVLASVFHKQNSLLDPGTVIRRWEDRRQKNGISSLPIPFGYGDGGGGATRDHLEYSLRIRDLEGVPRTKMCSPCDYFKDLEENSYPDNKYVGELYFQAHRGTYTSQAKTKKGNRLCEFSLRETDFWGTVAGVLNGYRYPYEAMEKMWKKLLFNQFHDIIPGSSIHRVHQEAERDYAEVLEGSEKVCESALSSLFGKGGSPSEEDSGLTVLNSLNWSRSELIYLPEELNFEGTMQTINGRRFAEVTVPPCGWTALPLTDTTAMRKDTLPAVPEGPTVREDLIVPSLPAVPEGSVSAGTGFLENDLMRVEFNSLGEITLIYDKKTGSSLASGLCNSFRLYKDVTSSYDAWDIDSMYENLPVELEKCDEMEVVAEGPLVAILKIKRKIGTSLLTQEISLRRDSRRLEFKTMVDWQESHKLLKVAFPMDYHVEEALHEIQFGHIKRPTHRSRQYDADRYEVCNHKWTALAESGRGCALLNDCKYGISVSGGCMSLTLLKSALIPDMTADKGLQEFTYAFYFWNGPLVESGVIREAYGLNQPVSVFRANAGESSLFSTDCEGIILETVKPAEDRSSDMVLRLYEAFGTKSRCSLHTQLPVKKAFMTDMLENNPLELKLENGESGLELGLEFRPFEIKTIRLSL